MAKSMDSISKTPGAPVAESQPQAAATKEATPSAAPTATSPAIQDVTEVSTPVTAPKGEDSYETLFPEPSVIIDSPPQWVWWLLLIVGSAVLGLIAFKLVSSKGDSPLSSVVTVTPTPSAHPTAQALAATSPTPAATPTPSPTPTPAASATPSPSPSPSDTPIDKSSVSIRVLNGSTVAGAASSVKTLIEKAGFSVRTVGNAVHQNYESTVIYYQSGKQAQAAAVQQALSSYAPTLQESSLADPDNVLVVVGPH